MATTMFFFLSSFARQDLLLPSQFCLSFPQGICFRLCPCFSFCHSPQGNLLLFALASATTASQFTTSPTPYTKVDGTLFRSCINRVNPSNSIHATYKKVRLTRLTPEK
jgi:hypothetical protein